MDNLSFTVGTRLTIDGKDWKIVNVLDDDSISLENIGTGAHREKSKDELLKLYAAKRLYVTHVKNPKPKFEKYTGTEVRTPVTSIQLLDEKKRSETLLRKDIIHFVRELTGKEVIVASDVTPDRRKQLEGRFVDQKIPESTTICTWMRRYKKSGDSAESLIDRKHLRGRTGSRIDVRAEQIISDTIVRRHMTKRRSRKDLVFHLTRATIDEYNKSHEDKIPMPSRATVYRRIHALNAYDVDKARYGREYADKKYRVSLGGQEVNSVLERVEVDDTPLDSFLIDDITGEVIGRVTLTTIIDCWSRMILGFSLSIGGTPSWCIKRALFHAIMPKTYLKTRYPDKHWEWPCYGIGLQYWFDNGSAFFCQSLRESLFDLKSDAIFIPRRTPMLHGIVERVQKTENTGLCDLLPGKSFFKASERHEYDSVNEAAITISQFEELFHQWVIESYSQTVHATTGETPLARWNRGVELIAPRLPPSADALEFALSEYDTRTLSHKGIEINCIQYNSAELGELRRRLGDVLEVAVRFFPDDLTTIFVAPFGSRDYVAVPAVNYEELVGLSLHEHRLSGKGRRKAKTLENSHATSRLCNRIDEMERETKLKRRTQKARLEHERNRALEKQKKTPRDLAATLAPKLLVDCDAADAREAEV